MPTEVVQLSSAVPQQFLGVQDTHWHGPSVNKRTAGVSYQKWFFHILNLWVYVEIFSWPEQWDAMVCECKPKSEFKARWTAFKRPTKNYEDWTNFSCPHSSSTGHHSRCHI